jgi:hypothetical protein
MGHLLHMYTINALTGTVRDPEAHYGAGDPGRERYPAEIVLRDLRRARGDREVPLILARYAAVRAWLLSTAASDPALAAHARLTAGAHLDAAPQDWPERPLLRCLLDPAHDVTAPWDLLVEIATAAEAAGHTAGALAARQAAAAAAVRARRHDAAAAIAAEMAARPVPPPPRS